MIMYNQEEQREDRTGKTAHDRQRDDCNGKLRMAPSRRINALPDVLLLAGHGTTQTDRASETLQSTALGQK